MELRWCNIRVILFVYRTVFVVQFQTIFKWARILSWEIMPDLLSLVFQLLEHVDNWLHGCLFDLALFIGHRVNKFILLLFLDELLLEFIDSGLELNSEGLDGRYADIFSIVASLQTPLDVHIVVFDDSQNNIWRGNALSSLSSSKHKVFLYLVIDILLSNATIR